MGCISISRFLAPLIGIAVQKKPRTGQALGFEPAETYAPPSAAPMELVA